jgi:hypothetical protein
LASERGFPEGNDGEGDGNRGSKPPRGRCHGKTREGKRGKRRQEEKEIARDGTGRKIASPPIERESVRGIKCSEEREDEMSVGVGKGFNEGREGERREYEWVFGDSPWSRFYGLWCGTHSFIHFW